MLSNVALTPHHASSPLFTPVFFTVTMARLVRDPCEFVLSMTQQGRGSLPSFAQRGASIYVAVADRMYAVNWNHQPWPIYARTVKVIALPIVRVSTRQCFSPHGMSAVISLISNKSHSRLLLNVLSFPP